MRKILAFVIVGSLLALSACKEQPPSNVMFDDGNNDSDIPPPIALNQAYAEPDATVVNITNTLPAAPPPAFTDKQQISDDADATGMTARLPGESPYPIDNGAQPEQPAAE
jgi:hypothetical protein